jgi:hypothetical protein
METMIVDVNHQHLNEQQTGKSSIGNAHAEVQRYVLSLNDMGIKYEDKRYYRNLNISFGKDAHVMILQDRYWIIS